MENETSDLRIEDVEQNKSYVLTLNNEDYLRACNDEAFAASLLNHARDSFPQQETVGNLSASQIERSVWTRNEILQLISLYEENQHIFKNSTVRKEQTWSEISKKIPGKTADQCRNKFKYLKSTYVKKKDNMSQKQTGTEKFNFQYFEEMDQIFSKDHNVNPVAIASSSNNEFPESSTSEDLDCNPPKKKFKRLEKTDVNTLLLQREENAERRHLENLKLKNEALDLCKTIVDIARNIVSKK